ncbi:MAG: inositol 2-dehydrogenase [Planctomycetes bacterium]|nr:inositol 2-dehydrogenase [Planctomycetota bacterium]
MPATPNLTIGIIGAGRIGGLHAENLTARVRAARVAAVADVDLPTAQRLAARLGIPLATRDHHEVLQDPAVQAVAICSATDTHLRLIEEAVAHGKHIFCEKPLGLEVDGIKAAVGAAERAGVKLQVGFNRRFDPSFARAREIVAAGKVGDVHLVRITSRDPAPPPPEYVRASGGLLLDMAVHDFDMVRFLTGREAEEVYATGRALFDPGIAAAGDVDTCVTTLKLEGGALATIDNSRKAVYGYDQRIEVFGSAGMVAVGNPGADSHVFLDAEGARSAKPLHFFLERYRESYVAEMQAFVDCVLRDEPPPVTGEDGLVSVLLGKAATQSLKEGRPVRVGVG